MRVAERLRNYIETEIGNGNLHPGDRLPPLRSLAEIIGANYVTVHTAMERLRKERIVTASNRGTYLSGVTPLKVRINIIGSDLSAENIRKLLNKHLANTELYLDFDIHPFQDITDLSVLAGMQKNYPAAISISNNLANPADHLPVSSLKEFPDYKKHLTTLNLPDDFEFGSSLPFTYGTSAIGINRKLMKKIGFSPEKMVGGFSWWAEYKKKCAESGIAPAAVHLNPKQLYLISAYYPLFHALCGFSREKLYGRTPCFNTPEGKQALRIIADQTCIWDEQPGGMEFFQERTPLTLGIGTWISTQNNNPEYPWIRISDPEIIPYTNLKKKRCYLNNPPSRLEACFRKDLVLSEKKRVWEVMKIMTSRDFQLDYCGKSGLISSVKDIYPTEYYWNRDGKWNAFFPKEGDLLTHQYSFFRKEVASAISAILELYLSGKIDVDEAAERMDQKKEFPKL